MVVFHSNLSVPGLAGHDERHGFGRVLEIVEPDERKPPTNHVVTVTKRK